MKIKIYSIHHNRPDFIKWQLDSFNKHFQNEFEYFVVNNASDTMLRNKISKQCKDLNINEISTFSKSNLAGLHHAESLNHIWKNYCIKDELVMLIDGDVFLIQDFNFKEFLDGYCIAGPRQCRSKSYHYLTPTVMLFDIQKMANPSEIIWEGVCVDGVNLDTGGGSYLYYKAHPEMKNKSKDLKSSWHIKEQNKNLHCLPDNILNEYDQDFNIEFFGNMFLHYCRSSNWDHKSQQHHDNKTKFIDKFLYGCINKTIIAKNHDFQIDEPTYFGWY